MVLNHKSLIINMLILWHHYLIYISINHMIITMKNKEFKFYKVFVGIIYVSLFILILIYMFYQ
jgi:hypothetical protein